MMPFYTVIKPPMTEAENSCYLNLPCNGAMEPHRSAWITLMIGTKVPALRRSPVKGEAAGAGCDGLWRRDGDCRHA